MLHADAAFKMSSHSVVHAVSFVHVAVVHDAHALGIIQDGPQKKNIDLGVNNVFSITFLHVFICNFQLCITIECDKHNITEYLNYVVNTLYWS